MMQVADVINGTIDVYPFDAVEAAMIQANVYLVQEQRVQGKIMQITFDFATTGEPSRAALVCCTSVRCVVLLWFVGCGLATSSCPAELFEAERLTAQRSYLWFHQTIAAPTLAACSKPTC
mgnify:CR=1 FL=1